MNKVYYFTPNCDSELLFVAPMLTEQECENEYLTNKDFEVFKYSSVKDFEESFNNGYVSDEGIVRFF